MNSRTGKETKKQKKETDREKIRRKNLYAVSLQESAKKRSELTKAHIYRYYINTMSAIMRMCLL